MLFSTSVLVLLIVVLAIAWAVLTLPQAYFLKVIEGRSQNMISKAAATELLPPVYVESALDAVTAPPLIISHIFTVTCCRWRW